MGKIKPKRNHPKKKSIKSKAINIGSKRKLDRFGKVLDKGRTGNDAKFITRGQAIKKLQISLKDFRRLCILKGIYPRDPKRKSKGHDKTYYHVKDILYCSHEPLIEKFREISIFMRKVKKSSHKKEIKEARDLYDNMPEYSLDHLVRERYPTFLDAVKDLDDALSMIYLFSRLPSVKTVKSDVVLQCRKLSKEWDLYCTLSHCLRKVFISIKGQYYQAEILGEKITWIVPFEFTPHIPDDVDFNVMKTFLEFYSILLQFVLFKLYSDIGYKYPPQIDDTKEKSGVNLDSVKLINKNQDQTKLQIDNKDDLTDISSIESKIKNIAANNNNDDDVEEEEEEEKENEVEIDEEFKDSEEAKQVMEKHNQMQSLINLFSGLKFFISRECPIKSLEFVIKCFNGEVGYDNPFSPYKEDDLSITHQISDRPITNEKYPNREYIQPQWVYDSINAKMLLPIEKYSEGVILPPHLSPFVNDNEEGYIPEYRTELENLKSVKEIITQQIEDEEEASSEEEIEFNKELISETEKKAIKNIEKDNVNKALKRKKKQTEIEEENVYYYYIL